MNSIYETIMREHRPPDIFDFDSNLVDSYSGHSQWGLTCKRPHDGRDATIIILDHSASGFNTDFPSAKIITEIDIHQFKEFISPENFWALHKHKFDLKVIDPNVPDNVSLYISKKEVTQIQAWFKDAYERYENAYPHGTPDKSVSLNAEAHEVTAASKALEQADMAFLAQEFENVINNRESL